MLVCNTVGGEAVVFPFGTGMSVDLARRCIIFLFTCPIGPNKSPFWFAKVFELHGFELHRLDLGMYQALAWQLRNCR